jgi:bifunctional oligoribonuclease and PAP phosphatase NrnA
MHYPQSEEIKKLLDASQKIVVIQADNPDGDSLASSLALEHILGDSGKEVFLYCALDMPEYLRHLSGWDRVSKDIPALFDMTIIVDTSALVLLEKLEQSDFKHWVASKPVVVLDHHQDVVCDIPYASVVINDGASVSTGQVIYNVARDCELALSVGASEHIMSSILADSLGLASENTTAETYHIMGALVENGADRPKLEEARRAMMKMPEEIFRYKARLIERTEFFADGRIAFVSIPQDELNTYSPLYNPAPLIQNDLQLVAGVQLCIVLKRYDSGRITGFIRALHGYGVAADLATSFGGGGHKYASGFKLHDEPDFGSVKAACIQKATELLDALN